MAESTGEKKGLAAKLAAGLPDFLGVLGSIGIVAVAYLVLTNKVPKQFTKFYAYFYILAVVGVLGFLGEQVALTLASFIVPVVLGGATLALKLKPETYPIEDWWEIYSLLVIFSVGLLVFLFMRWEQLKKAKGLAGDAANLKARVDPNAAAKYRQDAAKKDDAGKDIGLPSAKEERKLKKKEEKPLEPVDPNETAEQRMEREMRTIKDEFSKKSMKLSTTLLRMKNLAKSLDRDEIFNTVLEIVSKGMDADRVQLLLNDEKEGKLRIVRAEGMSAKDYKDIVISYEENCIITFIARKGNDVAGAIGVKECDTDPKAKGLVGQGTIKTILAAPIKVEDKVFGVINIEKMRNPDYNNDDRNLLATCADIAGLVMKNAKLYSATMDDLVSTKKLSEDQLKKNEELAGSLSRIVSPSVAEMIMNNPSGLKLGGSKCEVTMFFSDIRGFTKMSDILMELDGTLDKYVGDELMALFGAPVGRPDDPLRAVLCGFRMLDALRELQKVWEKEKKPVIKIGIGINTGEVTAGYMGSEKQLSYTVIGDNVNLAARVMANAKPMQLLITKTTYDRVAEYFEMTALEPIMVKGKSMPIEIYEVLGLRTDVDLGAVIAGGKNMGSIATVAARKKDVALPSNMKPEDLKQNIQIDTKAKVIECANCGTENEAQIKFCTKCGMPIF
jgi:class 3 adenylate cyclase